MTTTHTTSAPKRAHATDAPTTPDLVARVDELAVDLAQLLLRAVPTVGLGRLASTSSRASTLVGALRLDAYPKTPHTLAELKALQARSSVRSLVCTDTTLVDTAALLKACPEVERIVLDGCTALRRIGPMPPSPRLP